MDYPKFTVIDAVRWKFLPSKFGGGEEYLWAFKYAWVIHNKHNIIDAARTNHIPAFLLAGVALREVGGKDFTDWPVFIIRSFDWIGPVWIDNNLTITKNPAMTSMGAVSIQLRRAAETVGLDTSNLSQQQLNDLAFALQSDITNLNIVAKHLEQLILKDFPKARSNDLTDDQIRIAGTRYWYGPEKTFQSLQFEALKSGSYGSFILRNKLKIVSLLQ